MMTEVTGFAAGSVPLVLALFGIGMTLGALAAGPLTDRALRPTLYGSLAALALVLTAFHFTAQVKWAALVTVVLIGAVGFLTTTPLQMLVMNKAQQAPTLAAASNQSAFNLANAGGAWVGGLALAAGWGWTSPTLVGAVLAALGLAVAVVAGLLDRGAHDSSRIVARSGKSHSGESHSGESHSGGTGSGETAAGQTAEGSRRPVSSPPASGW